MNRIGFDELVRVEIGPGGPDGYDTLFIGRDDDPMQVQRRFVRCDSAGIARGMESHDSPAERCKRVRSRS
jgi:hypothetical protein